MENLADLQQRIVQEIIEMNANPALLDNVVGNFYSRVFKYMEASGQHFWQFK